MKLIFSKRSFFVSSFIIISSLILLLNGCSQYEYSSPTPGVLAIKLRAYYTQFDTVFQDNNFSIKVSEIKAYRSDGVYANVLSDVKAIPPASGGNPVDVYNVLGRDAYDSVLVLGQYFLPPGDYAKIQFRIKPGPACILDAYRVITVEEEPSDNIIEIVRPFHIEEAKTTSMVVTIDLDQALKRLAYTLLYQPQYYFVSSELVY